MFASRKIIPLCTRSAPLHPVSTPLAIILEETLLVIKYLAQSCFLGGISTYFRVFTPAIILRITVGVLCHVQLYLLFIHKLILHLTYGCMQVDIQSSLYSCCIAPSLSNTQICLVKKFCMELICFRNNHADAYIKDIMSRKHVQVIHLFM